MNPLKFIKKVASKDWEKTYFKDNLKSLATINLKNSDEYVVFSHASSKYYERIYLLLAIELNKQGIPTSFPFKTFWGKNFFDPMSVDGNHLSNSITLKKGNVRLEAFSPFYNPNMNDWNINLAKNMIVKENFNFFSVINNTLRRIEKLYTVDYESTETQVSFKHLLQYADILYHYYKLFKKFALLNDLKLKIVAWEINYIPNGIFNTLIQQDDNNKFIELIDLCRSYKHYFGSPIRHSYMAIKNITKENVSSRIYIKKEDIEELEKINNKKLNISQSIESSIKNQKTKILSNELLSYLNLFERTKKRGKKIYVLFSHLFFDTPINDSSAAFSDMTEWIEETINFFVKKDDLLVLKPHPSEIRPQYPEKEPNQTLSDFVADKIKSQNIVLLKPKMFKVPDISEFMTCGLVWRSTVAFELTYLEVPTIIAGDPGYRDLDFNYAESKTKYFEMIQNPQKLSVKNSQIDQVSKYFYLMEHNNNYLIDAYYYDDKTNKYYWNRSSLEQCIKGQHENLRSLAEEIIK